MSVAEAQKALQVQDKLLKTFPEVERVFGKAGRANTPTDPAPFSMMETTVLLKPELEWREAPRWYSAWAPEWLKGLLRPFWRDRITEDELIAEMDAALQAPGHLNAWDHAHQRSPRHALDRHPDADRHQGERRRSRGDPTDALAIEAAVKKVPGTRSVYAERVAGGYFLDFVLNATG